MGKLERTVILLTLAFAASAAHAQNRSALSVYVPVPEGGTAQQREYFQNNFKMELVGANYPAVETKAESAYTLLLNIQDNPDFNSGATVDGQVDENTLKPYELGIKLVHSTNDEEVVSFSFLFDQIESMNEWNLYLLYQALANAYVEGADAPAVVVVDDRWRNKRLYLTTGLGLDMGYFLRPGTFINDLGYALPAASVGAEWHLLRFLSLEPFIKLRFMHDREDYLFAPGAGALVKGVLKPGAFMLEFYGGAEYNVSLLSSGSIPFLSLVGGIQAGVRAGANSAFTVDFNVSYSLLGNMELREDETLYKTLKFNLMAGFKTGWGDHKP